WSFRLAVSCRFFFYRDRRHHDVHSFPTRRSSDLRDGSYSSVLSWTNSGHKPTLRTAPTPPGLGSPVRAHEACQTSGRAHRAQLGPSVSRENSSSGGALLVRLISKENLRAAIRSSLAFVRVSAMMGNVNATRSDVAAPRWLTHLLRTTSAPFPVTRAIRAAVALATPLLVALLLGDLATGALVSIGALPTVLADSIGTYRHRARRLAGAVTAAIVGYCLGMVTVGLPVVSFVTVVLVAAVSVLISTAGSNASTAGLQLFIFTVVAAGQAAAGISPAIIVGLFAAGAVWGTIVALSGWPVRATSPEREAVAQVYIELATMLSAADEPTARAARHQLTTAMNTAYDRLLTARSWLSGRDATYRDLLEQLAAATPTVEASVAMLNAGVRAPVEVVEYLRSVAAAVLAGTELPVAPPGPEDSDRVAALYAGLAKIRAGATRARNEQDPLLRRERRWLSSIVAGPLPAVAVLRLICLLD